MPYPKLRVFPCFSKRRGQWTKTSALRPSNDGVRGGHIEFVKVFAKNPSLLPGKKLLGKQRVLGKNNLKKNMGDIQIIHIQNDGTSVFPSKRWPPKTAVFFKPSLSRFKFEKRLPVFFFLRPGQVKATLSRQPYQGNMATQRPKVCPPDWFPWPKPRSSGWQAFVTWACSVKMMGWNIPNDKNRQTVCWLKKTLRIIFLLFRKTQWNP